MRVWPLFIALCMMLLAAPFAGAATLATPEQKQAAQAEAAKAGIPIAKQPAAKAEPGKEKAQTKAATEEGNAKSKETTKDIEDTPLSKEARPEASEKTAKSEEGSSGFSLGRTIFGLLLVLGAIWVVKVMLTKVNKSRLLGSAGGSAHAIDVLATTPLAPGRSLHVVRIGSQTLLVGATEQTITKLTVVGDEDLAQSLVGETDFTMNSMPSEPQTGFNRFIETLQKMTAR